MTMKLFYAPGACSFVPHTLLEVIGQPFEAVHVKLHKGEQDSPEYRAINPRGQVPVLDDDGAIVTQIVAIVSHLDRRFPQAGLLPREVLARTRALETLLWMNNTAHPAFTHYFKPEKFAATPEAQAEIKSFNAEAFGKHLEELEAMAGRAAAAGRPWLVGESFGPVDAYAITLTRWGGFAGHNPERFPALWAHVQRVAQHPPVARAIERERLQLNVYKAAAG